VKNGPMMLAAVETVTKADPVWESRRHNSDVAAKATARESVHAASPLKSSGRNVYNEPRRVSVNRARTFPATTRERPHQPRYPESFSAFRRLRSLADLRDVEACFMF